MTRRPRPPFRLTLVALDDPAGVPPRIRVKRALKVLLRSFGLRCIRIEPAPNQETHHEVEGQPPGATR
jgi:hypothetical protein